MGQQDTKSRIYLVESFLDKSGCSLCCKDEDTNDTLEQQRAMCYEAEVLI